MERGGQKARCVNCRVDILVPDSYAHGDHIKCGGCGTQHKVVRAENLRLVIADPAPLKEALRQNRQLIERLEAELRAARGSFGVGTSGFGVGLIYTLWQVGQRERLLDTALIRETALVVVGSGIALEVANYLFLAKRKTLSRLSAEIAEARNDGRQLEQKLREASRV